MYWQAFPASFLISGVTNSPYTVNCDGDAQVLYEVRQFRFDEQDLQRDLREIFKPKRVFGFGAKDVDCSNVDRVEENPFYLTETKTN